MVSTSAWRGTADLVSEDGQLVLPLQVVLAYVQPPPRDVSDAPPGRWSIQSAAVSLSVPEPDLRTRIGETFTLRLRDDKGPFESEVLLQSPNYADPRHPKLVPSGKTPLFPR
jgi:hypothetical protein